MNCIDCRYSLLKDGHYNCTYEEGECVKVSVLEKENAALKGTIRKGTFCGDWNDDVHMCQMYLKHEELQMYIHQLTEAKEILKDIISSYGSTEVSEAQMYLIMKRAEQFLKEVS